MRRLWIILAIIGALCIGWGVSRGQFGSVKQWANTLCTSCIGLVEKEH